MAVKQEDMLEYCERCNAKLELSQIGLCDDCQEADFDSEADETSES